MQTPHIIGRAREKTKEAAEKTGEAISKALTGCWGKTKGSGKDLKKELSRVHGKTKRNRTSKKRRKRKGDKK
jgi:hypothetical protein